MHLIDSFMPLIAYVVIFQKNVATMQPAFEQVKADIQRLLYQGESSAKRSAISPEDFDQARFMICAWVDEAILGSDRDQKIQSPGH